MISQVFYIMFFSSHRPFVIICCTRIEPVWMQFNYMLHIRVFLYSRQVRRIEIKIIYKKNWRRDQGLDPDRLLSSQDRHFNHYTRMFLCLYEAVIESYSQMGDSVQFV